MPYKPLRTCREPGCRERALPREVYCFEHKSWHTKRESKIYQEQKKRDPFEAFYHSMEWRRLREQKLREQPLCEECLKQGLYRAARVVDHITPIKQGGAKLDLTNLQSLCTTCHARKSVEEGSRF